MAKSLRIGFLQASNEIDVQWFKPLSFGYLKAYLDKYLEGAFDMHFIDAQEDLRSFDIIAVSSTSQDFYIAKEIAASVKKIDKDIITILGGHHITYLPQTLTADFDIGVLGEGEETFREIMRYFIDNGLALNGKTLNNIKGIVYWENGHHVETPRRDLISPLDAIPFPYRLKGSEPYLFSSRGCPYKCAFCSSSAFWQNTRYFSAEYVVKEIEYIMENFSAIGYITIWDDLFIANKARFKQFIELVEKKGLNDKLGFAFSVRANLVDDELCKDLKRINVKATSFGAESGSDRILKLLKKGTTVEINQRAIDILYKHDISVICSFIAGTPSETENEVRSTYEFILKNITDGKLSPQCAVNILMPMPGTDIWRYAVDANIIDIANFDWKRLSVFASYRHSLTKNYDDWVEHRRNNNSIYLAEETLPQERLYEIMRVYEKVITALENNKILEKKNTELAIREKELSAVLEREASTRYMMRIISFLKRILHV